MRTGCRHDDRPAWRLELVEGPRRAAPRSPGVCPTVGRILISFRLRYGAQSIPGSWLAIETRPRTQINVTDAKFAVNRGRDHVDFVDCAVTCFDAMLFNRRLGSTDAAIDAPGRPIAQQHQHVRPASTKQPTQPATHKRRTGEPRAPAPYEGNPAPCRANVRTPPDHPKSPVGQRCQRPAACP